MHQPYAFHSFIFDNTYNHTEKQLSLESINEIQKIHGLIEKLDKTEYKYISKALIDYRYLRTIPRENPFFTMGLFSILESLLVHHSDVVPINHQIRNKFELINNRFEHQIDFSKYFEGANSKTIISRLYEYRSKSAHGDFVDFNSRFQVLKKPDLLLKVIDKIVKRTLKLALEEPRIISDLKEC